MENFTLGKKIRFLREMKNLKQENMAELLEMTNNGYGKIERDETDVSYSRLNQIAEVLGMSVADLVNMQDQKIIYSINNHQPVMENMINNGNTPRKDWEERIKTLEEDIKLLKNIVNKQVKN